MTTQPKKQSNRKRVRSIESRFIRKRLFRSARLNLITYLMLIALITYGVYGGSNNVVNSNIFKYLVIGFPLFSLIIYKYVFSFLNERTKNILDRWYRLKIKKTNIYKQFKHNSKNSIITLNPFSTFERLINTTINILSGLTILIGIVSFFFFQSSLKETIDIANGNKEKIDFEVKVESMQNKIDSVSSSIGMETLTLRKEYSKLNETTNTLEYRINQVANTLDSLKLNDSINYLPKGIK